MHPNYLVARGEVLDLLASKKINLTQFGLLAIIDSFASRGQCYASNQYLATACGVTRRAVQGHIQNLVAAGLLQVHQVPGKGRYLTITYPDWGPAPNGERGATSCMGGVQDVAPNSKEYNITPQPGAVGGGADMPFFKQDATSQTSHMDKQFAIRLRDAMYAKLTTTRPVNLATWANHFRLIRTADGIDGARVERVLAWYCDRMGGQFVPVAPSASSFRKKFFQIEAAMQRDPATSAAQASPETLEIVAELEPLGWPRGSAKQLPAVVQASLERYGRVRVAIATAADTPAQLRAALEKFAMWLHYEGGMPPARAAVTAWYTRLVDRLRGWEDWGGKVPVMGQDDINHMGHGWAEQYLGLPDAWDQLMEAVDAGDQ